MTTGYLDLAQTVAKIAREENATEVMVLDLRQLTVIADFFVIASGRSTIQVKSIAGRIEDHLLEMGHKPLRREGFNEGRWIVLDYGGIIIHLFRQEEREFYRLENLWRDAGLVPLRDQMLSRE